MPTTKVYHATTKANLPSIQAEGLRVALADPTARLKGCWVCTASNRGWAILHTQRKHHASLEEVVVLELTVQRATLTRYKKGLYFSRQDIPATRITGITEATTFGASASN